MSDIFDIFTSLKKINCKRKNTNQQKEECFILQEIKRVKKQIYCDKNWLNVETDNDLIEACIYELKALEARYKFLFRIAQNRGISVKFLQEFSGEV
ncbi:MAG: YaaL family protein [Oscillospiraceae bacterium]|jgi:hypothetical protein|nr:YaaL family protein [Oscillospiraceae bacterium]